MNRLLADRVVSAAARGRVLVAVGVTAGFLTIVVQFLVLPALDWANDEGTADEFRPAALHAISVQSEDRPPGVPAEQDAAAYHFSNSTPRGSTSAQPPNASGGRRVGAAVDHRAGVTRWE